MKKIEYLAVAVLSLLIFSFFYNKGVSFADEGYILHSAQRLFNGELPYKDFNFIYTPLSLYAISLGFLLFGESILTGRILVLIIAVITSLSIYLLIKNLTKNKFISFLSVLVYLSWAPTHISFPLPINFCILTGILSLIVFTKIADSKRREYYFILGVLVSVTFLFKQNFGISLFTVYAILFIFFKNLRQGKVLWYFAGSFLGILSLGLYLFVTNSLSGFVSHSYYSFDQYFPKHTIKAPSVLTASSPIISILKLAVYLSPLIISLFAIFLSFKSKAKEKLFALSLFVIGYYLVGIYPSTDYVHLSPLLALLFLPLIAIFLKDKKYNFLIILLFIAVISAGFYTALFKGFYRWSAPIIDQKYFSAHPRIKAWINSPDFEKLTYYIQENSGKDDYIYYYLFEPMFYFITDRKNPTKYLDSFIPDEKLNKEYVKAIKVRNTKLIITSTPSNTWSDAALPKYIIENYAISATIAGYTVWELNK